MTGQGYVVGDVTTPANVGNTAAQAVIDARRYDHSNQYADETPAPCVSETYPWTPLALEQLGDAPPALQPIPCVGPLGAQTGRYADYDDVAGGYQHYVPGNPLMGFCSPLLAVCPATDDFIDPLLPWPNVADPQHWQPLVFSSHARQTFVAPHWRRVIPFALTSASQFDDHIPPPNYSKNGGQYKKDVEAMIKYSRDLDDARKLIVEYWADGPDSEFPPGHWALFAQFVSRRDHHGIDEDVKMFFAMHNASFDAGIVAWHTKRKYDGVRPITAVRHLKQGQTIRAWGGPERPTEDIPGEHWMPYNPGTNLTPPFPGYFSGHSVFSRSSATVLELFTGSDDFGFSTLIKAGFGRVEPNVPPVDTIVAFQTFTDAADAAGLSR
ncbi:MAG: vanadium-dependent haloperoxidase, partial [Candidatus Rokuibacteriota bacterium]